MMNIPSGLRRRTGAVGRDVCVLALTLGVLGLAAHASGAKKQEKTPDFGPNVVVFNPSMPAAEMQTKIDAVYRVQEHSEFGPGRNAFLFLPGEYKVDVPVGFYTEVVGLGATPDAVHITGNVHADASLPHNNATCTFWRAAEGFSVTPTGGPETGRCSGRSRRPRPSAACTCGATWCCTRTAAGPAAGGCLTRWSTATWAQARSSSGSPQQRVGQLDRRELEHGLRGRAASARGRLAARRLIPSRRNPGGSRKAVPEVDAQGSYSVRVPALVRKHLGHHLARRRDAGNVHSA